MRNAAHFKLALVDWEYAELIPLIGNPNLKAKNCHTETIVLNIRMAVAIETNLLKIASAESFDAISHAKQISPKIILNDAADVINEYIGPENEF
jgi:hypothetical protein